jgi:NHL repeat
MGHLEHHTHDGRIGRHRFAGDTSMQRLAVIGLAILLVGCGSNGAASIQSSSVAAQPSVSASATPAAPTPAAIKPGTVAQEGPLKVLWTAKGVPAEPKWVGIPAIAPDGRIWVLPEGQSQFWIFDKEGKFVEAWGEPGKGDGQFDFKTGSDTFGDIAFAKDGGFYVSEAGNHRIQQFDKDRTFVAKWGSFGTDDDQFVVANQIELDGAGNVYVHDDETQVVKEFTADGTFVRTFAEGSYPFFHVDEQGHVFEVIGPSQILNEYAPDGSIVRSIDLTGLMSFEAGIQVDPAGDLWVASNKDDVGISFPDRLLELDPNGKLLHDWKDMGIAGLLLDPDGTRIYANWSPPDLLTAYALPGE